MNHEQALALFEMEVAKYEAALTILASRCKDEQLAEKIGKLLKESRGATERIIMVEDMRIE